MSTTVTFDPPEERHSTLWISDGNVVLSAESLDKARTILFRIHKSLLSDQSEVFASMFAMPQGLDNEGKAVEMYEGLPLVKLPDDAESLEVLIQALRDTLYVLIFSPYFNLGQPTFAHLSDSPFYEHSTKSDTPLRVQPALLLASKYLMNELRAKLIRIVEFQWPLDRNELERRDAILDRTKKIELGSECEWSHMYLPEPAAAISLAEEFNIQSIMPAAYYDLMRCSPSRDWDDALEEMPFIMDPGNYLKPARWHLLPPVALLKLLKLRDLFENREFAWTTLWQVMPKCESRKRCREILTSIHKSKNEDAFTRICSLRARNPLFVIRGIEERLLVSDMCLDCNCEVEAYITTARNEIWEELCRISCAPVSP
ncbi:hypothetical protein SCHPADRAFT_997222 [Schizopora paradoxa]|uniref:BTB domain-containing protein n=1 Tax=Schizopora paradoxa TaxID=27342 RepID=A0A0H2RNZ6_9AGAM|nr:hypothetical protein SCHPADRAFT_997222 [Schizopora paradoxa]